MAAALYLMGAAAAWLLLGAEAGFPDVDAYYHLQVAAEIWQQGGWADIRWLPFTALGAEGPDHQWLFHLLIAPFSQIQDTQLAMRLAAAALGGLVPLACGLFLRDRGLPIAFALVLALLAFAASPLLPERFITLRAQTFGLVMMLALAWALLRGRALWVGTISALFMAGYHAAPIVLLMTLLHLVAKGIKGETLRLNALIAALIGLGLGLLVNPWFPRNIEFLFFHTLLKAASGHQALVGNEWYSPGAWTFAAHLGPVLLALVVAAVAAWSRGLPWRERLGLDTWMLLGFSACLLWLYADAVRFEEYAAPWLVLTLGLLLRDAGLTKWTWRWRKSGVMMVLAGLLLLGSWRGAITMAGFPRYDLSRDDPIPAYVRSHAEPGAMIYNSHWPHFQGLVWQLPAYRFVAGLDGHFLAYGDPRRFALWYALSGRRNDPQADPSPYIAEEFGANWAIIARGHWDLVAGLDQSPHALRRAENKTQVLFEILPSVHEASR